MEMARWRGLSTSLVVDKDIRLLEEKHCSVIPREHGVALFQDVLKVIPQLFTGDGESAPPLWREFQPEDAKERA